MSITIDGSANTIVGSGVYTLTSPTLVTPALGTPASGTLDNCTSNTETAANNSTQLATTAYADRLTGGTLAGAFTTLSASTTSGNAYATISRASQAQGQVGISISGGTSGTDWLIYQPTSSNILTFFGESANRMELSSTGLAVTGALSASGAVTAHSGSATGIAFAAPITYAVSQEQQLSFLATNAGAYYGSAIAGGIDSGGIGYGKLIGFHGSSAAGVDVLKWNINGLAVTGTIQGSTTIGVGNATPAASGAGITFPATQSASSDANTLDDYEEGTWTPTQGAGLTVVGAFSSSGRYTKIGRCVQISGRVIGATSIATTTGTQLCTGLPFTVSESVALGAATNGSIDATGVVGALGTQIYSATTIGASAAIDFSCAYTV